MEVAAAVVVVVAQSSSITDHGRHFYFDKKKRGVGEGEGEETSHFLKRFSVCLPAWFFFIEKYIVIIEQEALRYN